ncbi:hypothetical protein LLG96_16365 [bacterium]|nr:hypothetical protein [bacterium]
MVITCREVRKYLDNLLNENSVGEPYSELAEHMVNCQNCSHEYEMAQQILASITPVQKIQASPGLKHRIMTEIDVRAEITSPSEAIPFRKHFRGWKIPSVAAAFILVMLSLLYMTQNFINDNQSAPQLLSRAWAAEESLFKGNDIVHIVNEILVEPVSDPVLTRVRWFPVTAISETGKIRTHQLNLPAEPLEQYTVRDESWFEFKTGRFAHIFSVDGIPVCANSFDGKAVYTLDNMQSGGWQIHSSTVTDTFQPPKNPAEYLGIGVGMSNEINPNDVFLEPDEKHKDSPGFRFVRADFKLDTPVKVPIPYLIFKIRESDNILMEMEWVSEKESMMKIRRVSVASAEKQDIPWSLTGTDSLANSASKPPKASIRSDMVITDVSVRHMVRTADFDTYVFAHNPPWTDHREITDILDLVSPPHRMFSISYRAGDGRHVVFVQSPTYNMMLKNIMNKSTLKYTSPNGFKVWSGSSDTWLANILLTSARSTIKDIPSKDVSGYILESPDGTFPCLAVNGTLSDNELHNLVDSLVSAKDYREK